MSPERWQQIEGLFHAAALQPAEDRAAFLSAACAGDESLRSEVENLLASHDEARSFMKAPALESAAKGLADERAGVMVGKTRGHYKILSLLGAGGMGKVYLAEDARLGRKVALKLLTAYSTNNKDSVARFQQEARAASGLSHPNIAHIYEIGEAEGTNFIAMEYIDGQSLGERIGGAPLATAQFLNIGIQIADALEEAHSKGITHRDIKSANIMVTARDAVKVLDFGLAKLTSPVAAGEQTPDSEVATRVKTRPGVVMGTVSNMSPEQALGREVDHRTDIFSLGVVLYEMATGRLPFTGESVTETIDQIAHAQPEAIARFNYDVPAELESIVKKALRKARDERYQTARDVLVDLKSLKEELEFEKKRERSTSPELSGLAASRSAGHEGMGAISEPAIRTAEIGAARPTSSAEYVVSELKRHKQGAALALAALVIMIAGLAFGLYKFSNRSSNATTINSIAVLPFVNASADAETEYLSDGITESLINSLSQLPNLKMIARSSVFRYKGKEVNPQAAGRELGVQAILTGRVVQHGDNLSISVELVDVQNNSHLWGEQYNRKLADLLTIQSEISLEISQKLRLRLAGEDQKRVTKHYTENTEAYQLYLKGRYYWNKRTAEGIKKAVEQFQQAIDKDPNYALAHAGLADSYLVMQALVGAPTSEVLPKAKAAALRAVQIDDSLAEAHASLALIYADSWQWGDAEAEFRRAIQLNPNYPTVHHWYSLEFTYMGRPDEAMAEIKRAQELDPLSPIIAANVARNYILRGNLDAAIAYCNNSIELDPKFPDTHVILALAYQRQGRYEEAIAEAQKGVELSRREGNKLGVLGYCYAVAGKRSEALAILRELEEKHARRESMGAYLAWVYAASEIRTRRSPGSKKISRTVVVCWPSRSQDSQS